MRLPKIETFDIRKTIELRQINKLPKLEKSILIMTDKDKVKLIKTVEKIVRGSIEYKDYIQYLRNEIDMTQCSFFNNISNKDGGKVSIEIHHEPFTLFDITQIIVEKCMSLDEIINPLLLAEEVMKLHYQNKVGLIPLSVTVHQLVTMGKLFIPLQNVYGDFITFLEEYDAFIIEDIKDILECKLKMSKELTELDLSKLEKKYIYLEVDGMIFPQLLST